MLSGNETNDTINASLLLKVWDYVGCSLTNRMKNGLIYGMSAFMTGTAVSLSISEIITGGYRLHVLRENTCSYLEEHAEEYGCNYNSSKIRGLGYLKDCRQFLNETNSIGKPTQYSGPLVNCTSTDQANQLVETASEYGEAQRDAWYPGAAKMAAYCSSFVGVGCGAGGFLYGFFKKPAAPSNAQVSTTNHVTHAHSTQGDHYLILR